MDGWIWSFSSSTCLSQWTGESDHLVLAPAYPKKKKKKKSNLFQLNVGAELSNMLFSVFRTLGSWLCTCVIYQQRQHQSWQMDSNRLVPTPACHAAPLKTSLFFTCMLLWKRKYYFCAFYFKNCLLEFLTLLACKAQPKSRQVNHPRLVLAPAYRTYSVLRSSLFFS